MKPSPDELAHKAIVDAVQQGADGQAICAALVRLAGQALARFSSHDRASRLHAQLARRHAERAARCWRP